MRLPLNCLLPKINQFMRKTDQRWTDFWLWSANTTGQWLANQPAWYTFLLALSLGDWAFYIGLSWTLCIIQWCVVMIPVWRVWCFLMILSDYHMSDVLNMWLRAKIEWSVLLQGVGYNKIMVLSATQQLSNDCWSRLYLWSVIKIHTASDVWQQKKVNVDYIVKTSFAVYVLKSMTNYVHN